MFASSGRPTISVGCILLAGQRHPQDALASGGQYRVEGDDVALWQSLLHPISRGPASGAGTADARQRSPGSSGNAFAGNAGTAPSACSHPSSTRPATPKPHDRSQQAVRGQAGEHQGVQETGSTPISSSHRSGARPGRRIGVTSVYSSTAPRAPREQPLTPSRTPSVSSRPCLLDGSMKCDD